MIPDDDVLKKLYPKLYATLQKFSDDEDFIIHNLREVYVEFELMKPEPEDPMKQAKFALDHETMGIAHYKKLQIAVDHLGKYSPQEREQHYTVFEKLGTKYVRHSDRKTMDEYDMSEDEWREHADGEQELVDGMLTESRSIEYILDHAKNVLEGAQEIVGEAKDELMQAEDLWDLLDVSEKYENSEGITLSDRLGDYFWAPTYASTGSDITTIDFSVYLREMGL